MSDKAKKVMPVVVPLFRQLFVITDPGRDQDDEDVIVMLNRLIRLQLLEVMGVIANLAPSVKRAQLAKGTFDQLHLPDIPVAYGSACKGPDDDGLDYQFAVSYLARLETLVDGKELIYNTLKNARPKSIVLLLISGLTDAAAVLREHPYLFSTAVRRVVIMGGVKCENETPVLDAEGRMLPDPTAQNHTFDMEATEFLYKQLQDICIPMTVLSRHSAIAAKVPRSVYDDMAATGHPIGKRLLNAQKQAIEELWRRANLPAEAPGRMLPARCDRNWFLTTFCGIKAEELATHPEAIKRTAEDSIWDLVQYFNLYDPCTLLACIPNLREYFFSPTVVEVHGVEHLVLGVSATTHNVRQPEELALFLKDMLVESLAASQAMDMVEVKGWRKLLRPVQRFLCEARVA